MATTPEGRALPPPRPILRGVPGGARHNEIERRHTPSTQRNRAWGRETFRERRLGNQLDRALDLFAVVLHDRHFAAGSPATGHYVDHIVVAPTGVWVVNTCHDGGRIESVNSRLQIGEVDHVGRVAELSALVDVVHESTRRIGFGWVDVSASLCCTSGDWGRFAKPFHSDDVLIAWPKALIDRVSSCGPVSPDDINTIAHEISNRLPPVDCLDYHRA